MAVVRTPDQQRTYNTEWNRRRRAKNVAAGLCGCGRRKPRPGYKTCERCGAATTRANRRRSAAIAGIDHGQPPVWVRLSFSFEPEEIAEFTDFCDRHSLTLEQFFREASRVYMEIGDEVRADAAPYGRWQDQVEEDCA